LISFTITGNKIYSAYGRSHLNVISNNIFLSLGCNGYVSFLFLLAYITYTKGFHCDTSTHAHIVSQANSPLHSLSLIPSTLFLKQFQPVSQFCFLHVYKVLWPYSPQFTLFFCPPPCHLYPHPKNLFYIPITHF
jgi:hypothetical protein